MKKIFVMLFVSISFLYAQDNFVRGVYMSNEWFKVGYETFLDGNYVVMRDSLHLNWMKGLAQSGTGPDISVVQNVAGLNVIGTENQQFISKARAQRMVFEAEQSADPNKNYFAIRNGNIVNEGGITFLRSAVEGVMVQSPIPDNEYDSGRHYTVSFILKRNPEVVFDELVAKLQAVSGGDILGQRILFGNDFSPGINLETKTLEFVVPSISNSVNIVLYSYGHCTVSLDKVIIEDDLGKELFSGMHDNAIRNVALNFKNNYPLVKRFYLQDEPTIRTFLAFHYVDAIIRDAYGTSDGCGIAALFSHPERFLMEAQPKELMADWYPILANIPTPAMTPPEASDVGIAPYISDADYTQSLQDTALKSLTTQLATIASLANQYVKNFWFVAQLHGVYFENSGAFKKVNGEYMQRPPTGNELKAMCNLAVAYGAKGIVPFMYARCREFWDSSNGFGNYDGIVSATPDNEGFLNNHSSNYETYHSPTGDKLVRVGYKEKWDALAEMMDRYERMSPTLASLHWQGTKDWKNNRVAGLWPAYLVPNIKTNLPSEAQYIESGYFTNSGVDYFFIVNRRTLDNETRNITVSFNNTSPSGVSDVASGTSWIIAPNGTITDSFSPGEGKLYRVLPLLPGTITANTTWSGAYFAAGNVTISNNATLTINAGTNIFLSPNVKIEVAAGSRIVANGTSSDSVRFARLNSGGLDWNNILLYGDNNQFTYCSFDGGTYEVQIQSRNNQFTNCTFKNGGWGVYSYYTPGGAQSTFTLTHCLVTGNDIGMVIAGARPSISQTTIRNNSSYGIILQNSVTDGFATNTIKNNGSHGLLVGTGGIAYITGNLFYNDGIPWQYEIYVDYYGYLNAGQYFRGGVLQGYNKISSTTGKYIYSLAMTYNGEDYIQTTIPAQYNRWGEDGSVSGANFGYTLVDYGAPLSYDPTTGNPQLNVGASPGSSRPVTVLTSEVAQKIAATANTSEQQFIVDLKTRILEVKGRIGSQQSAQYEAKLLGELNALSQLDRDDNTGEKASVRTLLSQYCQQLSGRPRNLFEGLCNEAALINEVQNAVREGDMRSAQYLINEYSRYVQNEDNKRALLLAEVAIDERLGEYTQAMAALNKAKSIQPESRRMRRHVAPSYDYLETMILQKAKAAGIALDGQMAQEQSMPTETLVLQNFPNPFNPTTVIKYQLTSVSHVSLKVYDVLGREVSSLVDGKMDAGYHTATFDGSRLSSGIYFAQLIAQPQDGNPAIQTAGKQIVQVKKMLMIK